MQKSYNNVNQPYAPNAHEITMDDQNFFTSARTANSFIAKVILFFGLAIMISAAGTYTGFQYFGEIFLRYPAVMWIFFAVELILVLSSRAWSAIRPLNCFLFGLFAFTTGMMIVPLLASLILEFGGPDLIIKAFLATTLTFSASAVFGWTTNRSLSGLAGFLWMAIIGMIVVSIVGIFIPWGNTFEMIFSGLGVIVFSAYTMYDIQQLKSFPPDRYIDAALRLYLDIFNLFLYILRLIAGVSRK